MVSFDVVESILLRSLGTDLLRCKSVCKSWYSLISSPSFVKLHLKHICSNKDHNTRIAMCNPYTYIHTENVTNCRYYNWSIGGSSNGLVCMYESSEPENPILVTNPLTGEFIELEMPSTIGNVWELANRRCLGFGYDSSTDDYKVVMANYKFSDGDNKAFFHILSLKSKKWKHIGKVSYRFDHDELATPGILFNGALHWFMYNANREVVIVSFDLAKEEFREIPQPDDTRYLWKLYRTLGIFDGSLCIFTRIMATSEIYYFSIWVMKNYDVEPSWELLPITHPSEMRGHAIHYMLKSDKKFPYYCDGNIQLATSVEHIRSHIFVPTLVSPDLKEKGETEEEENGSKEKRKIVEILPEEEQVKELVFE